MLHFPFAHDCNRAVRIPKPRLWWVELRSGSGADLAGAAACAAARVSCCTTASSAPATTAVAGGAVFGGTLASELFSIPLGLGLEQDRSPLSVVGLLSGG